MSGLSASATSEVKSTQVSPRAPICARSARTRGTRAAAISAAYGAAPPGGHPQNSGPHLRRLPSIVGWSARPRARQAGAMTTTPQAPVRPAEVAVTPDLIVDLALGFMASKHLFAASELGLFEA